MPTPTKAQIQRENSSLKRELKRANKRADGWANLLTGQGVAGQDSTTATSFRTGHTLKREELNKIYRNEGFGKRVVNIVADEMVREWFTVSNDTDNLVIEYLNDLKTKTFIRRHLRWDRLTGGAVTLMYIDDGSEGDRALEQPLNEQNIRAIRGYKVYDRWAVTWEGSDLYTDETNPKYGQPEYYTINPQLSGLTSFKVHESRLLITYGADIPDIERARNNGWGDSVIQSAYEQLRRLGSVYGSIDNILKDFIQAVLSIENLQDLIASGKEELVKKRLQILDMSRHMLNTMLIDTRETYEKKASTVTGLDGIVDKFASALSAVTGIPVTLLMGETAKGLNSAGAQSGDVRNFYDAVAVEQEVRLQPLLERLVYLSMIAKEGPTKGSELDGWAVDFVPLWQPTQKEVVEMRKTQAESDQIYYNIGSLTPEEIRESRFGGESYSIETQVDGELPELDTDEPEDNPPTNEPPDDDETGAE